ncbi:MAG: phosphoribosylanthranilate isomerase [Bacteroidales bacterium]|nr:phosphoribosylanthranilate isomerase [Bacteroidales bacterium]
MKDDPFKIKVCGMKDPENIKQLVKLKPDYIGFILYPYSKRYVGDNFRVEVKFPGNIRKVGVTVNALFNDVVRWANILKLDYVQLQGDESPEYCRDLKGFDINIIKSFGINESFDFSVLNDYMEVCEFFLFDTKTPLHGGSGKKFEWGKLSEYELQKFFFLSGGIGPDDASNIKKNKDLPIEAIDINSKFETEPAMKDINLLKSFIKEIRE